MSYQQALRNVVLAVLLVLAPLAARADGAAPQSFSGGLKLVWGAMPVPDFSGAHPIGSGFLVDPPPGFAMALTMPDAPDRVFMFSPRLPQLLPDSTTPVLGQRTYLGFTFDLGQQSGLYGSLGLGGSVATSSGLTFDDLARTHPSASLLLHGGLEFGYRPDANNSVSLSLDQAKAPDIFDHSDSVSSVRLRYGFKF